MRLGIMIGYAAGKIDLPIELVQEADRLGVYAVWSAEAYGSDAVTPLAWLGALTENIKLGSAIMQMPGRTPANAAMTAMTLNQLSHGRFLMGLGLSGPQVVEGWHGESYSRPLTRTREYVEIVRKILAREERLTYDGRLYQIPYQGADATGLGKPLKSTLHAQPDIPIYLAAIGPKNVELTAEIADGWLPIFFSPQKFETVYGTHITRGLAKAGKTMQDLDIAPSVSVVLTDNLDIGYNALRPMLALYIGGMGAKGHNFYTDLAGRYGYAEAAAEIQELFLAGQKGEAMMKVPTGLIDEIALVGSRARIKDRLQIWLESPITTLNMMVFDIATLRTMVELVGDFHNHPSTTNQNAKINHLENRLMQNWKTLSRQTILDQGKFLRVENHVVQLSDGRIIKDWPWVITPDFVNILAATDQGQYLIFRQTKYSLNGNSLAPVGGYLEPEEEPLTAAQRELLEETGYTAEEWISLGSFPIDGNRGAGTAHFFLAFQAHKVAEINADDLEEQKLLFLSIDELGQALSAGEFKLLPWATIVALALHYKKPPIVK